jgi:uncharacterized protein YbjT (DUF2867 family)
MKGNSEWRYEMITVMGATGQTGRQISHRLLDAGEEVRAVGRSASRLDELGAAGARCLTGDATDAAFLAEAFRGADAVYTLLPYDPRSPGYHAAQDRLGEAIVRALRDAGVPRAVALSSVGADLPSGTGFIASLHRQEARLRQLDGTDVLVLRAGSFFENFLAALEPIANEGINGDTVAPGVRIPMIATRDVAAAAAAALGARDWTGFVVRELLGERDLSYAEATRIIGERIGRPDLAYVQLPEADVVAALTRMGFAEDFAALHVELNRALSDGTVVSREGRTAANTTPTRFEDFASELAASFQPA